MIKMLVLFTIVFLMFLDLSNARQMTEEELRPMVRQALQMRGQQLLALNPTDMSQYCPQLDMQNTENRARFWEDFFLAYIDIESVRVPSASYRDTLINPVKRGGRYRTVEHIGLMQVSVEASAMVGCSARSKLDLRDPEKNINCGIQIFNQLIPTTNAGSIRDKRKYSYANFERENKKNKSNPPTDLNTLWGNENFPSYPLGKNSSAYGKLKKTLKKRCATYPKPNAESAEELAHPGTTAQ